MAVKRKFDADALIQEQVDQIDEAIERIEARMAPYEKLATRRDQLRAARRALLGGTRSTGAGSVRLRQEDIVEFLKKNPGSPVSAIASHFSVAAPTVSSHLYRGRDERFLKKNDNWYLRDPEAGMDTEDDVDDE